LSFSLKKLKMCAYRDVHATNTARKKRFFENVLKSTCTDGQILS